MLYLGEEHIEAIGFHWPSLMAQVHNTIRIMDSGHYAQPLKPYLRYNDVNNRIIAMPAYVGGSVHTAGLKWISSFPGNRRIGLPRAHSVTILNEANTGQPYVIVNTPLVSMVRTAAVSGVLMQAVLAKRVPLHAQGIRVGIIGWGPIGRMHAAMCVDVLGDQLSELIIYDIRGLSDSDRTEAITTLFGSSPQPPSLTITSGWQELYTNSDIVITCTVSEDRYIDLPPATGQLLLHVSLRDYSVHAMKEIRTIIVDDWDEVCRENTDIHHLHLSHGLSPDDTLSLADVVVRDSLANIADEEPILFCPMGMASFDIAVAAWFAAQGTERRIGTLLP